MALGRRSFYEDPDARISILARAGAHGPDTLMQTVQIKSTKLLADGAGHTFLKGTDLSTHSADNIAAVAAALNARPRKTLTWQTPAEALDQLLISAMSSDIRN
jgi:hypothetical protein